MSITSSGASRRADGRVAGPVVRQFRSLPFSFHSVSPAAVALAAAVDRLRELAVRAAPARSLVAGASSFRKVPIRHLSRERGKWIAVRLPAGRLAPKLADARDVGPRDQPRRHDAAPHVKAVCGRRGRFVHGVLNRIDLLSRPACASEIGHLVDGQSSPFLRSTAFVVTSAVRPAQCDSVCVSPRQAHDHGAARTVLLPCAHGLMPTECPRQDIRLKRGGAGRRRGE
ncbi:MAG: hypothetical protein QOD37_1535 [Gaiellales bacterium]|nr:hypothetical protein [Gaiellales bacterium]